MAFVAFTNVAADIIVVIGGLYVMWKAHKMVRDIELIRKNIEKKEN